MCALNIDFIQSELSLQTEIILTLLGDDRGAPSGWRIIHSNDDDDRRLPNARAIENIGNPANVGTPQ